MRNSFINPTLSTANKIISTEKQNLHPRNKHRGRYDFVKLSQACPALAKFVQPNAHGNLSIDFANAQAVLALNKALLITHYDIAYWDLPEQFLCPAIPGRADYLHYLADLLGACKDIKDSQYSKNNSNEPIQTSVNILDIGVGANVIYPIIGQREYGWLFVGADISPAALKNAQAILNVNNGLADAIRLRLQPNPAHIFKGIIQANDYFEATMCNPPFHASLKQAQTGSQRKLTNLAFSSAKHSRASIEENGSVEENKKTEKKMTGKLNKVNKATMLNFGGQNVELYCDGGELAFLRKMINESTQFKKQCKWFTSLVSKAENLPKIILALKVANAVQVKTIDMSQGQKKSRIIAWTYLNVAA